MLSLQIIGNLGADAELRQSNGGEYVAFRVAHSESVQVNGQPVNRLTWVDVTLNGNGGNLLQYLRRGTKVFVTGVPAFRVYSSAKDRCYKCGVSLYARSVELCGGSSDAVPRELSTSDGLLVQVNKHYHTPVQECWNSTLLDRSLHPYTVDANGFITPDNATTPASESTEEPAATAGANVAPAEPAGRKSKK